MSTRSGTPRSHISRREFVRDLTAGAGVTLFVPELIAGCASDPRASTPGASDWDAVPGILERIRAPEFPARTFSITDFGAAGDGATDCTTSFRRAIAACGEAGGGRVVVPPGRFLTGPIQLQSNVNLHVVEDAVVLFSTEPSDYPRVFTRWEGVEVMNYSPLIYAFEQENIAITGSGVLDGQAAENNWWLWNRAPQPNPEGPGAPDQRRDRPGRNRLFEMAEQGVPVSRRVFGQGHYLRPNFIQPYRCDNVLIEGVSIRRSPMWQVHPVLCQNVTVRGLDIVSHGPNNDGCNPESCQDVLIEDCHFDTGDDCIAIKSGRNRDGRRVNVSSENIVIRRCRMKDGHGGVTMGSEISGGVRGVFAEDCEMDSPNLDRALRLKTNAMRGGVIERVRMRNVRVGQVGDAVVHVDFHYEEGPDGDFLPTVRDIEVRQLTSSRSPYALYLRAFPNAPITDVRIIDCQFDNVDNENVLEYVEGLELDDVRINGELIETVAQTG